jgi:hypothetical protein
MFVAVMRLTPPQNGAFLRGVPEQDFDSDSSRFPSSNYRTS